mgnify:CR=1 FL=1
MKRFQITEAEYEAIKAKEAKTKDKNISRRLRVLMLRYEGKKLDEITKMTNLHRTSITQMCRRYREQGLEEYAGKYRDDLSSVSGARLGRVCAQQVSIP